MNNNSLKDTGFQKCREREKKKTRVSICNPDFLQEVGRLWEIASI